MIDVGLTEIDGADAGSWASAVLSRARFYNALMTCVFVRVGFACNTKVSRRNVALWLAAP